MTEIRELIERLNATTEEDCLEMPARTSGLISKAAEALTSLSSQVEALKAERTNLIETLRSSSREEAVAVLEEGLRAISSMAGEVSFAAKRARQALDK